MGNSMILRRSSESGSGKVILSDGTIHQFDKPLTVAELMLEYPQHAVFELQTVMSGKKPTPLPADKMLETNKNKVYLMLPMRRGKPAALSSEEAHRLLLRANGFLKSKSLLSSSGFLPLFARICNPAAGGLINEVVNHHDPPFPNRKKNNSVEDLQIAEESKPGADYFPEILEGRPHYLLSRQFSGGKGWKPSLDTIKEKSIKMKVRHWLFIRTN